MPKKEQLQGAHQSYPRCKCADNIDKQLRARKPPEELVVVYHRDANNEVVILPVIQTQRASGRRGRTALLPNYCPFCGKIYYSGTIRLGKKKP